MINDEMQVTLGVEFDEVPLPADRKGPTYDPYTECHSEYSFRPYWDEIVHVVQALLPGPLEVQSLRKQGKRMDFTKWHLSEDASLLGVDKATMQAKLGRRVKAAEQWDSHGVELVSRIFPLTPTSFAEITHYLTILRGTAISLHGASPTSLYGMHVHVVRLGKEQIHEVVRAPSRRAGSIATDIDIITDLDDFSEATLAENIATEDDFNWDNWAATAPPSDAPSEPEGVWEEDRISYGVTRRLIFAPGMTVAKLSKLQESSFDVERVRCWILFMTGLVKLAANIQAEKFGAEESYAGEGYPQAENLGGAALKELWEPMEFEELGQEFFKRQIKKFVGS
ncbi:hypothetical protein MMC22_004857 [Lobaria immixta]|nr:hypothetical protein [Lobaria immixta]